MGTAETAPGACGPPRGVNKTPRPLALLALLGALVAARGDALRRWGRSGGGEVVRKRDTRSRSDTARPDTSNTRGGAAPGCTPDTAPPSSP